MKDADLSARRGEREETMWSDFIARERKKWIGKRVRFEGAVWNVVDVDINGALHIDRPTKHNKTTAIGEEHIEEVIG